MCAASVSSQIRLDRDEPSPSFGSCRLDLYRPRLHTHRELLAASVGPEHDNVADGPFLLHDLIYRGLYGVTQGVVKQATTQSSYEDGRLTILIVVSARVI